VVYFEDGKVVGIVVEVSLSGVKLEIKVGGTIHNYCNVKFVGGKHFSKPIVTKDDITDVATISQQIPIDFISIPFISGPEDIVHIKKLLGPNAGNLKVIAKIDTKEGVSTFSKILDFADGAIFVRNEIQWEMVPEKLVLAQKYAIE